MPVQGFTVYNPPLPAAPHCIFTAALRRAFSLFCREWKQLSWRRSLAQGSAVSTELQWEFRSPGWPVTSSLSCAPFASPVMPRSFTASVTKQDRLPLDRPAGSVGLPLTYLQVLQWAWAHYLVHTTWTVLCGANSLGWLWVPGRIDLGNVRSHSSEQDFSGPLLC